ncbi:MAG: glycosyltransferase [Terracidiphilus sp.]|jgi:glycosyltransferase involved in cell wall biosynthesis
MQPFSIVATVLNEVQDIGRLVPSLLDQVPPPAEIVIVDGGSTDGTWEWLVDAAREHPNLLPIRDETCNLKNCPGPVSRGRNVAIAAARSQIIACADAGCTYPPDWLARITAPIAASTAEYALGGACLDLAGSTLWDIASAPFFSVKLSPEVPTKSCTARSMAFTKDLWQRIGGFPESVLLGDDTLFDLQARRLTSPAFVERAKALYCPQNTLLSACHQLARYAISDGILGVRPARLFRNATRCLLQLLALLTLPWTIYPFLLVLGMQCWLAFHPDWRFIYRTGPRTLLGRLVFSVLVPWIVAANQIHGLITKKNPTNRQNLQP